MGSALGIRFIISKFAKEIVIIHSAEPDMGIGSTHHAKLEWISTELFFEL